MRSPAPEPRRCSTPKAKRCRSASPISHRRRPTRSPPNRYPAGEKSAVNSVAYCHRGSAGMLKTYLITRVYPELTGRLNCVAATGDLTMPGFDFPIRAKLAIWAALGVLLVAGMLAEQQFGDSSAAHE